MKIPTKKQLAASRIKHADGLKKRVDGWINLLTNLGNPNSTRDKRLGANAVHIKYSERELEEFYAADDLAKRVVDLLPEEALREWIDLKFDNMELVEPVSKEVKRLMLRENLEKAWSWARMYGGSGLYVNVDDGMDLEDPLDLDHIRSVRSFTVLSRFELWVQSTDIEKDIESPNFGLPEFYSIQPRGIAPMAVNVGPGFKIHYSRIIRFDGAMLPRQLFVENNYWNDSVLSRLFNVLRNYNTSYDSAAAILQDFRSAVYKIKGLSDLIASGKENLVKTRMEIIDQCRSVIGSTLIDDEESFEYHTGSVAGMEALLRKMDDRFVAATDMPHSIALGTNVRGKLGEGSGDNEKRDWYDHVRNRQQNVLKSKVDYALDIILSAANGPTRGEIPEGYLWTFKPLWQESDNEKATTRKLVADTDQIYIQNGILDSEEIRTSRFGGDEYSMETVIDDTKTGAVEDPEPDPIEEEEVNENQE